MTFFEHIHIIVLPKQQDLPTKKWSNVIFWSLLLAEGAYMPKFKVLKKLCLVYFAKVIKNLEVKKNIKRQVVCLKNAQNDIFGFFIT